MLGNTAFSKLPIIMLSEAVSMLNYCRQLQEPPRGFAVDIAALQTFDTAGMSEGVSLNINNDFSAKSGHSNRSAVFTKCQIANFLHILARRLM